jgi:hypothetical protein
MTTGIAFLEKRKMIRLDLHGVRHHQVDRLVENFIFKHQNNFPIEVICGNSNRMIALVMNVVKRLNCEAEKDVRYGVVIIRRFLS